jgi:hypothetical protein
MPICFLISANKLSSVKRVSALDTGAFSHDFYLNNFHRKMVREDFALEPKIESAARLVTLIYGSNGRYLRNEILPDLPKSVFDYEVEALVAAATNSTNSGADERSTSIEVQLSDSVDLRTHCEAIVLPYSFAENREIQVKTGGVTLLPYSVVQNMPLVGYTSQIYDLVVRHLKNSGP